MIPRTFPPAPGWSPGGHRITAPLEYSRGPEKTWVYGGLRVQDGQALTMCAPSRNSQYYQDFLQLEEQANPDGTIWVITGNLSSHDSKSTQAALYTSFKERSTKAVIRLWPGPGTGWSHPDRPRQHHQHQHQHQRPSAAPVNPVPTDRTSGNSRVPAIPPAPPPRRLLPITADRDPRETGAAIHDR